jgi:stage V sporulation protein B
MVLPLVLFPSAISASFAGLLIPEVAESVATKDQRRIRGIVCTVMETVLIFSIGCAGVMMSFSLELGATVYPEAENAGKYIMLIAPLVPVMYLDTAVDSMLKGLGEQLYSMRVNIVDSFLSVVLVVTLLPLMGIKGYVVVIFVMELFNTALSIIRLLSITGVSTPVFSWVFKPLVSVLCATVLTRFIFNSHISYALLIPHTGKTVLCILEIIVCALIYLFATHLLSLPAIKRIKLKKELPHG